MHEPIFDVSKWDMGDYAYVLEEKIKLQLKGGHVSIDFSGSKEAIKEILEDALLWLGQDLYGTCTDAGVKLNSAEDTGGSVCITWGDLSGSMSPYEVARHLYFAGCKGDEGWCEHVVDGLDRGLITLEEMRERCGVSPEDVESWRSERHADAA